MQAGVFFKWWLNKAHSVKRRECKAGDIYSSETEYGRSGSALGHEMAARAQWGTEKEWGVYRDIMDTGAEGHRVRRAGVEECSCKSFPCVTLKLNTRLLSCKMTVRLATPDGDGGESCPDPYSPTAGHTWLILPYLVNRETLNS